MLSTPKHLDAPLVRNLNSEQGPSFQITGTAYPGAHVLFYINDQYVEDVLVEEDGSFSKTLSFEDSETVVLELKQTYKNVTSEFGNEMTIKIDATPPDRETFSIFNKFPQVTRDKNISIIGYGSPGDYVVINNKKYKVNEDGKFELNYGLQEGSNNLEFSMVDAFGNDTGVLMQKTVSMDSIPPKISNLIAPLHRAPTEESVVIDIGNWQGYLDSYNSVAITGSIQGDLKSLTVDGKAINWDENKNIYQRMNLFIYGGLNKYKVVAEDVAGNISTGFVQTTATRDTDELNVNLNDY